MTKINDQTHLRDEQYKDASNLNARIRLHVEFSTNKHGWYRWLFDQFELPAQARVLEFGCGPGNLWIENIERIPEGWEISLSDFSSGMINQAWEILVYQSHPFDFVITDVQPIPFEADQFDIVIANHFLYHVPDRPKETSEIRRVLKPGGRFYATTIGIKHMKELPDLVARFDPDDCAILKSEDIPFIMENGADQLREIFPKVEKRRYQYELRVSDADVLVDYAFSGMQLGLEENRREEFANFIKQEMIVNGGEIHVQKDNGMLLAR